MPGSMCGVLARGARASLLVALVGAGLVGCGGDSSPTAAPTPTPSTREVILAFPFQEFASGYQAYIPVYVPKAGRVDVTVDWTYPDTWIYVYFGDQLCGYRQVFNHSCPFIVESEAKAPSLECS